MRSIPVGLARSKFNIFLCISVVLTLFAVSIHAPSAVAAPTVISTITVGGKATGVGVNSSTNRIYVSTYSNNTVRVIDGATNSVTATISSGMSYTNGVGVNSTTNRIYVANYYYSNTVRRCQ